MRSPKGIYYSLFLHAVLLVLLVVGLPGFLHRKDEPEPTAISVDILPRSLKSNVRPQDRQEKPEPKKPQEEKRTEKRATPEAKQDQAPPEEKPEKVSAKDVVAPPKPKPKPEPKPEPKPAPEPKKPEKPRPKPKPKQDDFDSILKSVEQTAKADESKKPVEQKTPTPSQHAAKSDSYDASQPLSMSDKDAIKQQIENNWVPPAGARDAANLKVTLRISVAQDGTVMDVKLAEDESRYSSDSFFRAAADSAMRAVHRSSPLKDLPADKYSGSQGWSEMELTFDPKEILN